MTTTLCCLPKDIPYLEESTVLTTPIDISVAAPVEVVKFYQSRALFSVLSLIVILLALAVISFYLKPSILNPLTTNFIMFACILLYKAYKEFKNHKGLNDCWSLFDNKFSWQTQSVIVLNEKGIEFGQYFGDKLQSIENEIINEFYIKGHNFSSFSNSGDKIEIDYHAKYLHDNNPVPRQLINSNKEKKYKYLKTSFELKHRFILVNGKYRIDIKDLVRLMNQLKNSEHGEVVYRKNYL